MKKFIFAALLMLVLVGAGGCATHYYSVSDNRLHVILDKPEAREIFFASSLDEYKLRRVEQMATGQWEVTLPPDSEFRYFYIVDGAAFVPDCKYKEKDDFGSEICIFVPNM